MLDLKEENPQNTSMKKYIISISLFLLSFIHVSLFAQTDYNQQWPGFRGPWACGYMDGIKTATTWNVDSTKNIKWKTAIPGLGHSCPVIWDNNLFVTTASSEKQDESLKVGLYGDIDMAADSGIMEFKVYCLDKNSGKIQWERLAHKGIPKSKRHTKSSQANCTPATDGKHLVVLFGSEGLYCYDLKGTLLWQKDLGIMNPGPYNETGVEWGHASSPVIYKDFIIIQCDKSVESYLAAFNIEDGKEIWRTSRDEVSTWGTPAIYSNEGKTQVIVNGFKHMGGYELETGKEIWRMSGGGDAPSTTPVVANNLIYINNAHGKYSPIYVVKPTAMGDITLAADSTKNKYITWSIKRGGAYLQTPLIYGDYLYNLQVSGQLTCFDAKTGEVKYKENLSEAFSASGIAADGKVYFTSEQGNVFVIQAGPSYKLLAKNAMNDVCMATPAISGNTLFFRTQHYVVAVESK
ncbi:MAG TPA: pyrrolo-quinoline quinone [Prolixibacteraceae bacterium]|jgi:outer membrane protein assembly factor BamB|nr:pyrrolo-quinoline quinone [Prolixibacteraceae bacterium]